MVNADVARTNLLSASLGFHARAITSVPVVTAARPKPTIFLDCDPGHDDAAAIAVAAAYTDVVGITTVSGNAPIEQTTHNALLMAQLFDLDVPVARGASGPLVGEPHHAPSIHGLSGLDGPEHPPVTREPIDMDAADFIVQTSLEVTGMWIVATGPLTNVALALQRDSRLAERISGISLMGGSATFGNWSAAAEFNIWADPEAAEMVFGCGAPIQMLGLNTTHAVLVQQRHVDALVAHGAPRALFMAELYRFFRSTYQSAFGMPDAPLHDPCAVLAVSHPELFNLQPRHVAIETEGRHTRGMTVVDERGWGMGAPPNTMVAYDPDAERILQLVHDAVTG
jgi:inosine-uridine nucleoside N-ribohydrolase